MASKIAFAGIMLTAAYQMYGGDQDTKSMSAHQIAIQEDICALNEFHSKIIRRLRGNRDQVLPSEILKKRTLKLDDTSEEPDGTEAILRPQLKNTTYMNYHTFVLLPGLPDLDQAFAGKYGYIWSVFQEEIGTILKQRYSEFVASQPRDKGE